MRDRAIFATADDLQAILIEFDITHNALMSFKLITLPPPNQVSTQSDATSRISPNTHLSTRYCVPDPNGQVERATDDALVVW